MSDITRRGLLATTAALPLLARFGQAEQQDSEIRLIVRSDDMGATHAINEACLRTVLDGVARSIEVIVPAPWFIEAAEMLQAHPEVDTGVHLDLTSEWSRIKWGPLSKNAPSLVDENGHFYPMTRQREGWPPGTGFLESGWNLVDVERELRMQIETALRLLPRVSHLSAHMGTATSTPELRELVGRLATEYRLPIHVPDLTRTGPFGGRNTTREQKENNLVRVLEDLEPGLWLVIEHPGLDTPEMRAVAHRGYEDVAQDRVGVTHAFTSARVAEAIRRRRIKLVSYADVLGS